MARNADGTESFVGTITRMKRLANTVNGNARWVMSVEQSDGRGAFELSYFTKNDSHAGLIAGNFSPVAGVPRSPVSITLDRSGRIVDITPA